MTCSVSKPVTTRSGAEVCCLPGEVAPFFCGLRFFVRAFFRVRRFFEDMARGYRLGLGPFNWM